MKYQHHSLKLHCHSFRSISIMEHSTTQLTNLQELEIDGVTRSYSIGWKSAFSTSKAWQMDHSQPRGVGQAPSILTGTSAPFLAGTDTDCKQGDLDCAWAQLIQFLMLILVILHQGGSYIYKTDYILLSGSSASILIHTGVHNIMLPKVRFVQPSNLNCSWLWVQATCQLIEVLFLQSSNNHNLAN